jgi:hypothetical protein
MRHSRSLISPILATLAAVCLLARPAHADDSGSASAESGPAPYAKFVTGAQIQNGLLNVIRKNGKVYLEIAPSQLDQDFIQSAETVNGLGGYFLIPGGITSWTRIMRFTRNENKMVITWPNTYFIAPGNDPVQRAISRSDAASTVAVAPIVATDTTTGHLVFDASFFLSDIYNLASTLKQITGADKPDQAYSLDSDRTLFGPTKAFPLNVIINADQTWKSDNPQTVDNVPDPRSIQFRIAYNIAAAPADGDYKPRLADDRVGFFDSPYLNFAADTNYTRVVRYVVRWNMQPSDPTKPLSPAKHPMVFYLSNNVPVAYRAAVRRGILDWNSAFEKMGISDAVQVKDQPDDPAWDPDDIRYNTVIWLTQSNTTGYAAENQVIDPRTGQEIRTNIVIDSDVMSYSNTSWQFLAEPTTQRFRGLRDDRAYGRMRREQAEFGKIALDLMGRGLRGDALTQYDDQLLESFVVHETGHSMGLQHNFISSMAYTAKQLQSKDFTSKHGVATSVMEYAPLNLWPRGYSQGTYWQTALGPYDYHAIHWGYATIRGARTPSDEVPTLNRWAASWTNPLYRFAGDEDVAYASAHAVDPRVAQNDLSNDPLGWAATQLKLSHDLMAGLDRHWPKFGHSYDQERAAFALVFTQWIGAATQPEHFIGGEYLSRAHAGDPGAPAPLTPVSRSDERRAFDLLDKYVLSEQAWNFSPAILNRLVYSEWESQVMAPWAYDPQPRHDMPVAEVAEQFAQRELGIMFQPLMFERLNDLSMKAKPGSTMSLTDLFNWTQSALYGDLQQSNLTSIGEVHRALQQWYGRKLAQVWLAPAPDTPYDAQSLARAKLVALRHDLATALGHGNLDELSRAHLESLQDVVARALDARVVVPAMRP